MAGRGLTDEQLEEIRRRCEAGEGQRAVALALGISEKGVNLAKHRLGLAVKSVALTQEQEDRIAELCAGGASQAEAAAAAGVSVSSVVRVLRDRGIQMKMGPERKFSTDREREITRRYAAGESMHEIARALGCGAMTVQRTIKRLGEEARAWPNPVVTEEQREKAVEACRGGATAKVAAEVAGISRETVFKELGERGVSLPQGRPRSCLVDDGAFDVMTPEAAYWGGFLWADGCIYDDGLGSPSLICGLTVRDRGHVEKLRDFLKSTHAIWESRSRTAKGGPCAYFRVRSKQICDALIARGFAKKRVRTPSPELVASRDFWRGAVDGDGWLGTIETRSAIYPYIGLSGQVPVIEAFCTFLRAGDLANPNILRTTSGVWKVQISGKAADRIIETLYKDSAAVLDRKDKRARAIIAGDLKKFPPYIEKPSAVVVEDEDLEAMPDE